MRFTNEVLNHKTLICEVIKLQRENELGCSGEGVGRTLGIIEICRVKHATVLLSTLNTCCEKMKSYSNFSLAVFLSTFLT